MKYILQFTLMISLIFTVFSCSEDEMNDQSEIQSLACFEVSSSTGKVGDEFEFSNCSENTTKFYWDFGDGMSSTQAEPKHLYSQQGEYEIKLLAGDDLNGDGLLNYLDEPDSISKEIIIIPNIKSIELTIYDATSWVENLPLNPVANAEVKLYNDEASFDLGNAEYTIISDENGIVTLYDLDNTFSFLLTIQKGDLSNIMDGYVVRGVFQSQDEVHNSASQNDAVVGGISYSDLNGDGIIDSDDKSPFDYLRLDELSKAPLIREAYIGM